MSFILENRKRKKREENCEHFKERKCITEWIYSGSVKYNCKEFFANDERPSIEYWRKYSGECKKYV